MKPKLTIKDEKSKAICLIIPFMLGIIVFYIFPFLMGVYYSVVESYFNHRFVFFKNYIALFSNGSFTLAVKNTLLFILYVLPIQMGLSFIIAYIADASLKKKGLFSSSILLPMLLPISAFYHFSLVVFSDNGIINTILHSMSLADRDWLGSESVLVVVVFIYLWRFSGFTTLLYLAGLQMIPKEYHDLAATEGLSSWKRMKVITLPLLIPVHFIVFIICLSNSLGVFKEIYLLGGRYPQSNTYLIQNFINNSFIALDYQKLTASSVVTIMIITAVLSLWMKLNKRYGGDFV